MKVQLLIPAAGMGTRLGTGGPKALVDLGGKPMVAFTLARLLSLDFLRPAIIVVPPDHISAFRTALAAYAEADSWKLIEGGLERQESVAKGLSALNPETEIVVIHDAARPFVPLSAVRVSIDSAADCGAATVAIPSSDTILEVDNDLFLKNTPDRQYLWACQTPQTFRVEVIRAAHDSALETGAFCTDDASLVRRTGHPVRIVQGSPENFKITTPFDLAVAQRLAEKETPS